MLSVDEIKAMQRQLNVETTGALNLATIIALQLDVGAPATGFPGPDTIAALKAKGNTRWAEELALIRRPQR